jgi:hypothetical protein
MIVIQILGGILASICFCIFIIRVSKHGFKYASKDSNYEERHDDQCFLLLGTFFLILVHVGFVFLHIAEWIFFVIDNHITFEDTGF